MAAKIGQEQEDEVCTAPRYRNTASGVVSAQKKSIKDYLPMPQTTITITGHHQHHLSLSSIIHHSILFVTISLYFFIIISYIFLCSCYLSAPLYAAANCILFYSITSPRTPEHTQARKALTPPPLSTPPTPEMYDC